MSRLFKHLPGRSRPPAPQSSPASNEQESAHAGDDTTHLLSGHPGTKGTRVLLKRQFFRGPLFGNAKDSTRLGGNWQNLFRFRFRFLTQASRPDPISWKPIQEVLKHLEGFLNGTPFSGPLAVLNTLIDIGNAVTDNREDMYRLVKRTSDRLDMINTALLKTEGDDTQEHIQKFAGTLIGQAIELRIMLKRYLLRRIWESEEDVAKVKEIFVKMDEDLKDFHIYISLSIERQTTAIFHSILRLHLASWPRSRQAVYDADIASTLTRRQCTEGTRTKIIDDIFKWARNSSSAPVYWLNGLAGTGKSTIAYTICHQAGAKQTNILVASFFCSRQIEDARERKYIIPTIVYQLARRSRSYAQLLLEADFDAVDSSRRQMRELLVDPWSKSAFDRPSDLPPRLVVIDALDECEEGYEFLRELLDVVQRRDSVLGGLKFLVTSRPDPKIVARCNGFAPDTVCHLHQVETEEVKADVRTFLTKELPTLHQKPEFEDLVEQAGILFIYAATAVRFISPDNLSESEQVVKLEALVKAQPLGGSTDMNPYLLDYLYRDVLRDGLRISHGEEFWRRRLLILHTILSVKFPHKPSAISALASTSDTIINEDMVQHVVDDLHAVLYVSSEAIYWHHKSFLDFMRDPKRAWLASDTSFSTTTQVNLSYDVPSQNIVLSRACLHFIQVSLKDQVLTKPQSQTFTNVIDQFLQADTFESLETVSMAFSKLRADLSSSGEKDVPPAWKICAFSFPLYICEVPLDAHLYDLYKDANAFMHSTKVLSYLPFASSFGSLRYLSQAANWLRLFYRANRGIIAGILPPVKYVKEENDQKDIDRDTSKGKDSDCADEERTLCSTAPSQSRDSSVSLPVIFLPNLANGAQVTSPLQHLHSSLL